MKSLFKATLIVTIFSIATRGLSFIYRIYLSRMIGSEGIGLYQIVLSIFAVLVTITSTGIPIAVSKHTASYLSRENRNAEFSIVTASLIVGLCFSTGIVLLLYLFRNQLGFLFADNRCMSIFMLMLPAVIASSMYSSFRGGLWGERRYVSYSIVELMEEVFMVISGIILLQGIISITDGAKNAVLSITISYIGASILTLLLYFMKGGRLRNPKGFFKPLIKTAAPITAIRVSSSLLSTLIAIILPSMLSKLMPFETAISQYGTMLGMAFPLLFLPGALIGSLALVMVPEISSLSATDNSDILGINISRAINISAYISFLIVPIYLAISVPICSFLYSSELAGTYLKWMCFMIVPLGVSQICSSVLSSLGKEFKALLNSLIGSIIVLAAITFLPQIMGIYALVLGYTVSLTITCILNIVQIKKTTNISLSFLKTFIILAIIVLPSALICGTSYNIFSAYMGNFLSLALSSILAVVMFVSLSYALNVIDFEMVLMQIKQPKIKCLSI